MKLQTTLAIIRKHRPCTTGWEKLLRHLGHDYPQDKVIDFATILESNGLDDALWGLRAVLPEQEEDRNRLARLFACDCAESVLHLFEKKYPDDKRVRHVIAVARRFALGQAKQEELAAAWDAWNAARDVRAAWNAVWDTVWDARAAAWNNFKTKFILYFCTHAKDGGNE